MQSDTVIVKLDEGTNDAKGHQKFEKGKVADGIMQKSIKQDLEDFAFKRKMQDKGEIFLHRICITGGPCAGKTTALAMIQSDQIQLGYFTLMVPEAATILMKGGAMIVSSSFTKVQGLQFQKALLRLQIALESVFYEIGLMIGEDKEVTLLIDRGLMDGSAYVDKQQWKALMDEMGVSIA